MTSCTIRHTVTWGNCVLVILYTGGILTGGIMSGHSHRGHSAGGIVTRA